MAITVTDDNANAIKRGSRVVVRNSNGIPYVVVWDTPTGDDIEVFKGDGATPTQFDEQDAGNGPSDPNYVGASAATGGTYTGILTYYCVDDGKETYPQLT